MDINDFLKDNLKLKKLWGDPQWRLVDMHIADISSFRFQKDKTGEVKTIVIDKIAPLEPSAQNIESQILKMSSNDALYLGKILDKYIRIESTSTISPENDRIKLAILDNSLAVGGAVWSIVLLLKYIDKSKIYPRVYSGRQSDISDYLTKMGIEVIICPYSNVKDMDAFDNWVVSCLDEWKPDIVDGAWSVQWGFNLFREFVPVVVAHAQATEIPWLDPELKVDYCKFNPKLINELDGIICVAQAVYDTYPTIHNKAVIIPSPIDIDAFNENNREKIRKQLKIEDDTFVIVWSGRISEQKRPDLLLEIVDKVKNNIDNVVFLVAACLPDYFLDHPIAQTWLNGLDGRPIIWIPDMKPYHAPILYSAGDIFLLNSDWEGLSLASLEALAAGLPVICTDVSGQREIISDGENGYLCTKGDVDDISKRIIDFYNLSSNDKNIISQKAKNSAVAYDAKINSQKTLEFYTKLLNEKKKNKIKVALCNGSFYIGGAEWLWVMLCKLLDRNKYELALFIQRDIGSPLVEWMKNNGFSVFYSDAENYDEWLKDSLPDSLEKWNADIVLPVTIMDIPLSDNQKLISICQNVSDTDILTESIYEKSSKILCVSEDVFSHLDPRYHKNMEVFKNSVDIDMFKRDSIRGENIKKGLNIDPSKKVILWVGRMGQLDKRLDILIECIKELSSHDVHFLIVGYFNKFYDVNNEKEHEWEDFCNNNLGKVTWIKDCWNNDINKYYDASDIYLSTSGFKNNSYEGLSMTSVQALANGLPIVSTKSGGQFEIIEDRVNGYLYDCGNHKPLCNKILELLSEDQEFYDHIRNINYEKASKEFNIVDLYNRLENIFEDLMKDTNIKKKYNRIKRISFDQIKNDMNKTSLSIKTLRDKFFLPEYKVKNNQVAAIKVALLIESLLVGGAQWQITQLALGLKDEEFDVRIYNTSKPMVTDDLLKWSIDHNIYVKVVTEESLEKEFKEWNPDIIHSFTRIIYPDITLKGPWKKAVCLTGQKEFEGIDPKYIPELDVITSVYPRNKVSPEVDSKTIFIPNGVDHNQFDDCDKIRPMIRETLGINDDATVFLFSCRLSDNRKRLDMLKKLINWSNRNFDNIRFIISGYYESLFDKEVLGWSDFIKKNNIIWINDAMPWDAPLLNAASDVTLNLSDSEGMSLVTIEGMFANCAVITTDSEGGGQRLLVKDKISGYISPPGNIMNLRNSIASFMLLSKEQQADMKHQSYRIAYDNYKLDNNIEKFSEIYRSLQLKGEDIIQII